MKIKSEIIENYTIIHINGRMDIYFIQTIEEEYFKIINSIKTKNLILNLSNVSFISSSGVRIMISTLKNCKEKNLQLKLCGANQSIKKVFELIEMTPMFEMYNTLEEAISVKK